MKRLSEIELVNKIGRVGLFQNDKIYKLFLHNILASKYSGILSILRGSSDEILPMLNKSNERVIGA